LTVVQIQPVIRLLLLPDGDARRAVPLTEATATRDGSLGMAVSADGGTIVYTTQIDSGAIGLALVGAGGSASRLLTDEQWNGDALEVSLAANAKAAAFFRVAPGGQHTSIWVLTLDGSAPRELVPGLVNGGPPLVMTDGTRVLYTSIEGDRYRLWTINVGGGTAEPLLAGYSLPRFFHVHDISADDRWLLGHCTPEGKPMVGCLVPVSGRGGWKDIGPMPEGVHLLGDGSGIAFVDRRDGIQNVWRRALAPDSLPMRVTNFATRDNAEIHRFAISSDRHSVVVSRGSFTSDILLITDR
jgi:hypothetical protein